MVSDVVSLVDIISRSKIVALLMFLYNLYFQTFYNRCLLEESTIEGVSPKNVTHLCEIPDGFVPNIVLLRMWQVVYWAAQLLTW